jgi:hypothetical protein
VRVSKMHRKGSGGDMSLIGAIRKLGGVIDWLLVCGVMKLVGINYVIAKSKGATCVSIELVGATSAYNEKTQ